MFRDRKPKGFFYLEHRTVDSQNNIITDVHITAGNVSDTDPYLERLDYQIEKYGFEVKYVGLDAGYNTAPICKGLSDRNIRGAIAYRLGPHEKGKYTKNKFIYVKEWDVVACLNDCFLKYKTTTREGYREYISNEADCIDCPHKDKCLLGNNKIRTIRLHVWEEHKEKVKKFTKGSIGKTIYKRRKETVERSFADSKELHRLRYARFRGIEKVREQSYMTATIQNIKRIVSLLSQRSAYKLQHIFDLKLINISPFKLLYLKSKPTIKNIVGLSTI